MRTALLGPSFVVALVQALCVQAQFLQAQGAQAPVSSAPALTATVQTIDGRERTGVVTFDGTTLVVGEDRLDLADALSLRVASDAVERVPAVKASLWLRSGAVLPCASLDGALVDGVPHLVAETASGARVSLPMSTIAALRSRANDPQTFAADRRAPDENRDFLYVVKEGSPQRFSVVVERVEQGTLHFDLRGKKYDFPLVGDDSVAAVVFGQNTGFAPDRRGTPHVQIELAGGERCGGALQALGETIRLQLDEGPVLEVPVRRLVAIDVDTDKLLWLSSAKPRVEQTAAFDRAWPWTADRSPVGEGIVLAGATHRRGLVLVPRTKLTYDLGGRFDRFEAVLGLDARSGPQAHAVMRVLVDGKVAFESTFAGASAAPQKVSLEIANAKELALEADFGEHFDLGDLCAFADARVLRSSGSPR